MESFDTMQTLLAVQRPEDAAFFLTLMATSVCAWLRYSRCTWLLGVTSLAVGLAIGRILPLGAGALALFAVLNGLQGRSSQVGRAAHGAIIITHTALALALCLHWMPGFAPWQWLPATRFHADAKPFVSFLNADKILVGCMLLLGVSSQPRARWSAWGLAMRRAAPAAVATVALLLAPAVLSGYVRFEPQLHPLLPLWAAHNMALVVLHEEVLFRHLLPRTLHALLPTRLASPNGLLLLTAAAFGAYHYTGGVTYVVLSACAGIGYGIARRRAECLEGGMLAHFALNLVHFVTFTYPSLARH